MLQIRYKPDGEPTPLATAVDGLTKLLTQYGLTTLFSLGARLVLGLHRDSELCDAGEFMNQVGEDDSVLKAAADPDALRPSHRETLGEIIGLSGQCVRLTPPHLQSAMVAAVFEVQDWAIDGRMLMLLPDDYEPAAGGGDEEVERGLRILLLQPVEPVTLARVFAWSRRERQVVHRLHLALYAAADAAGGLRLAGQGEALEDGVYPGYVLWWGGRSYKLQPKAWDLLSYMWRRPSAPIDDVMEAIWPDGIQDSSFRSNVTRLNNELLSVPGFPWVFGVAGGELVKDTKAQ